MRAFNYGKAIACMVIAGLIPVTAVHAQLGDVLKQGERAGSAIGEGALGNKGSVLSGQSLTSGSIGNVAGLLEFCVKNNYLEGDEAGSVKDALMGKLSGGSSSGSSSSGKDYKNGAKGLLTGKDGEQFNLGNVKGDFTKQICDKTLAQGKSLL